jgi:hypothetical protein
LRELIEDEECEIELLKECIEIWEEKVKEGTIAKEIEERKMRENESE